MAEKEEMATKPASSQIRLGGALAPLIVAAAIGLAASSSLGSLRIEALRKDLTSTAASLLKSWNISLSNLAPTRQSGELTNTTQVNASCACAVKRLSGVVDDCCCEYETVDKLNVDILQPLLTRLVEKPFFRFFKLRLWCDCPFWREDGMCHSRDCSVGECSEDQVPGPLRTKNSRPSETSRTSENSRHPKSSEESPASSHRRTEDVQAKADKTMGEPSASLAAVDHTVDPSGFKEWVEEDNPWTHDNEAIDEESTYVDLVLNPERYTGYKGDSARRIWQAIYQESCFQGGDTDECRERRVFYRLISGFHTSITVHVTTSFRHNKESGEWGPHLEMYKWRVANFPERLSNLYFTFLFVLRAAMKASDYLSSVSYDTGNPAEDAETASLVRSLVANERLRAACPVPFNEAELWKGDEGPQLFSDLQRHFRNISAIMDCVGCERCRLWGKLEMLGIATALKILFSQDGPEKKCPTVLQRNEVTALVNTLSRFSEALKSSTEMTALLEANGTSTSGQGMGMETIEEPANTAAI